MTETLRKRAESLAELGEIVARFSDLEQIKASIAGYEPRETDVVITPYGKSGTTWTQQIVHTLRTRGDMDFDDISRVVPWIETSGSDETVEGINQLWRELVTPVTGFETYEALIESLA